MVALYIMHICCTYEYITYELYLSYTKQHGSIIYYENILKYHKLRVFIHIVIPMHHVIIW